MSQMSFGDAEYRGKRKQTRREKFLAEMEHVVPWDSLLALIEPFYPVAGRGRHPYPIATMLRVHLMQNWFSLSEGLVHTVTTTAANEADVAVVDELLHGKEEIVYADAGYTGADKRVMRKNLRWEIAAKRSKLQAMKEGRARRLAEKTEKRKASIRAKVEHPFRVIKRQFGLVKVRFRGLAKNTAHIVTLFALSNLWMARRKLLAMTGSLRPKFAG